MPDRVKYALIGGGLAAASAARAIREIDSEGELTMLCAEDELPYHRPPLSKAYVKGEAERDQLVVQPASWYEKRGIDLRTGVRAIGLDREERSIRLADGGRVGYEQCLIATGGRARRLDLPGVELEGVHTLREVGDSERIRAAMAERESAVVVGASFIGMELASAFADAGLKTTVLELAPRVWPKITDERLAGFFQSYFEDRGVEFLLGDGPMEFEGDQRVRSVRTRAGRRLECDFVIVGVGIELNLDFVRDAGVALENGIVVDRRLRASPDGLWAAGDVAAYPDAVFDRRMRIEHWDNAKAQGAHAGRGMAGSAEEYDHMSYFFSDIFDLSLHVVGDSERFDRVLVRGSTDEASFLAFYLQGDAARAALTVNREWTELEAAKELLRQRPRVEDEARWTDESVPLEDLA
jgi:3-phenylpropionate/trans-cinnamate dioxygenase ferredoxin reductase subunit